MAFNGANMFALLDDEEGPSKPAARAVPNKSSDAPAKKPAKLPEKPAGPGGRGGNAGRGGGRQPRAPREFEGEVVGTEGGRQQRGGRGDRGGRNNRPREGGEGGRRSDRNDRSGRGHEGPHRGGAGKGNWGKPGDEADAPKEPAFDAEGNPVEEAAPEPEEPDNEMTLEDALKLKAEKKAALMAAMKKDTAAKVVDDSAFKGMAITKKDDADHMPGFELANEKAKTKRDREKKAAEKNTIATGFKSAPTESGDDRGDRGGRGGRGGDRRGGDRNGGRGGRGGRDERPRREGGGGGGGGGRGGFSAKIDDDSAFPTLGGK